MNYKHSNLEWIWVGCLQKEITVACIVTKWKFWYLEEIIKKYTSIDGVKNSHWKVSKCFRLLQFWHTGAFDRLDQFQDVVVFVINRKKSLYIIETQYEKPF